METEYYCPNNKWLRKLDIAGMVLAPLSMSLPFFLFAMQVFPLASSNGKDYIAIFGLIFAGLMFLIGFSYLFGWTLKRYMNNLLLRNDVIGIRILYTGLILGGLFMLFYFSPKF